MGVGIPKRDNDIDPVYIMVNQISEGKTNKGRKLYGRATRHRDVSLCCIGGLSFYLALVFELKELRSRSIIRLLFSCVVVLV